MTEGDWKKSRWRGQYHPPACTCWKCSLRRGAPARQERLPGQTPAEVNESVQTQVEQILRQPRKQPERRVVRRPAQPQSGRVGCALLLALLIAAAAFCVWAFVGSSDGPGEETSNWEEHIQPWLEERLEGVQDSGINWRRRGRR